MPALWIHRGVKASAALAFGALLGAVGASATHAAPAPAGPPLACAALADVTIPAKTIGLPSSGGRVLSATLQPASGAGPAAKPEYCRVLAQIAPVDPKAQPIRVQLNLPTAWNGKAVQMGGGGFDGFLVTAEGPAPGANAQPTPLSRGFATFGSDGGHSVANPFDVDGQAAAFMNDEVMDNYAGAQLKKVHDLAIALITRHYGKAPGRTYFIGASGGGREALTVAQKWGADYDGAIAYYPAGGGLPMVIGFGRLSRALAAPGAYPDPAKQAMLHRAVVAACDAADGAADGVVSNPGGCKFDVASVRCAGGADTGDNCLSDAQIAALRTMSSDLRLKYPLASGEVGIPGYNVFKGVDLTARISGLGAAAPTPAPIAPAQPTHYKFYDIFVRGWLTRDPKASALAFDAEAPGLYASRMSQLSLVMQSNQADLSRFTKHGGKLIMVQGADDALVPVGWSEAYYGSIVHKMGGAAVDRAVRFYVAPGYGHGVGSFIVDWDSLTALDNWVETGAAPETPIATDIIPSHGGRTRPLCRYPAWPRYGGEGDINAAVNFTCVNP